MDYVLSDLVARIVQTGQVSDADVMALRDAVWSEDAIRRDVLDALFMINDRCRPTSSAWTEFFVEAAEHALLQQVNPAGFLTAEDAEWLRSRIDREGGMASLPEVELLVTLLERAENAPDSLKNYALAQIEATIVTGMGPTRDASDLRPECVDEAEVVLLRRLIFAAGGEGAVVVGREEADMLFRIKDKTLQGVNAPGWLQLFVHGVGNHLMAHSDYRPLSREDAIRLNTEMDVNTPSVAGFFRRMMPNELFGRGTILEVFKSVFPKHEEQGQLDIGTSRAMTPAEAGWLKTHIAADRETDVYEKALLTFILDEIGSVPPQLEVLRRRA